LVSGSTAPEVASGVGDSGDATGGYRWGQLVGVQGTMTYCEPLLLFPIGVTSEGSVHQQPFCVAHGPLEEAHKLTPPLVALASQMGLCEKLVDENSALLLADRLGIPDDYRSRISKAEPFLCAHLY
jgi:hypothetical protein